MECHDRIALIVLAGKQSLDPDILQGTLEALQRLLYLRNHRRIIFFIAHLNEHLNLFVLLFQLTVRLYVVFQGFERLHGFLRFLRVVPEIRLFHPSLKLLYPLLFSSEVKVNPSLPLMVSYSCSKSL